jgi:hypothetical protein
MLSLSNKLTRVAFFLALADIFLLFGLNYDPAPFGVQTIKNLYFRMQGRVYSRVSETIKPVLVKFEKLDKEYKEYAEGNSFHTSHQKKMNAILKESAFEIRPKYRAYLFDNLQNKLEKTMFQCHEKIHVYIQWLDLHKPDINRLEAFWYRPDGKLQEITELDFLNNKNKKFASWLWLRLKKKDPTRGLLFASQGFNYFTGDWKIHLFLNGDFLEKKEFSVAC